MSEVRHTIRNGLLCAFIFAACYWTAWPIAEMGFDDDWSYIKSAQVFAQTGHFVYNGWATAMLGWQIPWGALFIRLFGFSFTAVKLSTFPVAIATLLLFHAIQLRFHIGERNAVIGTLALGLSPLFMPLAASYMTDIPGLFVILLCLYCCQRAVAARTNASTVAWLSLAAASNVVGGTVRQIAWLGALVMVPSAGWLLRKRRGVLPATSLLWTATIASVLYFMDRFARQPYSVPESISFKLSPVPMLVGILGEALCLTLMVYPVLVAWVGQICRIDFPKFAFIAFFVLVCTGIQWSTSWTLPWSPNLLAEEFSKAPTFAGWNFNSFLLPMGGRKIISLLVLATALAFAAVARGSGRGSEDSSTDTFRCEIFWLFTPFVLSYFVLLIPRASESEAFDRYMLSIMPFVIIWLIRLHQESIAPELPMSSIVTLALFTVLSIAGTHDWFALQRARLAAIGEVRASGVPRTEIQGDFEYDGWTQVENGGHINNPMVKVPRGAYNPDPQLTQVADGCQPWYAPRMPLVQPKYTALYLPKGCLLRPEYPTIQFRAWLPPFHRAVYVQRVPAPVDHSTLSKRAPDPGRERSNGAEAR